MFKVILSTLEFSTDDSAYWKDSEVIKSYEFETRKEANKFKREYVKKHNLIKGGRGGLIFYSTALNVELTTNY